MSLGTLRLAVRPLLNSLTATRQKLFSPKLLLYTNTSLTVSLSITGDIFQQWYQACTKRKDASWDKQRTLRMAGTGLLIGPAVHYWYIFLDRWLPGRTFSVLCKKIALDQLICSPLYLSLFMLSLGAMERKNWAEIKEDFAQKGSVLYAAEWLVWPPAQFVNFTFCPPSIEFCMTTLFRLLLIFSGLTFGMKWALKLRVKLTKVPRVMNTENMNKQKISAI